MLCGFGHEGKTFTMSGSEVEFYFLSDYGYTRPGFVITVTFGGEQQGGEHMGKYIGIFKNGNSVCFVKNMHYGRV